MRIDKTNKHFLIIGFSVMLLLLLVWFFYLAPMTYSVKNAESINRIEINCDSAAITLEKHNEQWVMTDGRKELSEERMDDFLYLLQNLIPLAKTNYVQQPSVIEQNKFCIKTYNSIFPLSNFCISTYDKESVVTLTSFFSTQQYAVELLNHPEIPPTELLSTEPSFWINTRIFENPQLLRNIKITHHKDDKRSFYLNDLPNYLSTNNVDTLAFYRYLSYFANLRVIHYTADTTLSQTPCYSIFLQTDTDTTRICLYEKLNNGVLDKHFGYAKTNLCPYVGIVSWVTFDLLLYPDIQDVP